MEKVYLPVLEFLELLKLSILFEVYSSSIVEVLIDRSRQWAS